MVTRNLCDSAWYRNQKATRYFLIFSKKTRNINTGVGSPAKITSLYRRYGFGSFLYLFGSLRWYSTVAYVVEIVRQKEIGNVNFFFFVVGREKKVFICDTKYSDLADDESNLHEFTSHVWGTFFAWRGPSFISDTLKENFAYWYYFRCGCI